jgi:hypothetical protein
MQSFGKFLGKRSVYQSVHRNAAFPAKGFGNDPDTEMGFTLRTMASMALVKVRLVDYLKNRRTKSIG